MVGLALFLGGVSVSTRAIIVCAGHAFRIVANPSMRDLERAGPLPHQLLHYTRALIAHVAQIAACNRHQSIGPRLCRRILSCLDRLRSHELAITQELIAEVLGVRSVGITAAAGELQSAGLIHRGRRCIVVIGRPGMEARVLECHAVVRREHDRPVRSWPTQAGSIYPERTAGPGQAGEHTACPQYA